MKLFFHFSISGFSNTYLIGREDDGDAIIVDPGVMNVPLLNMIEGNGYYVRSILVTHSHESHVQGIRTLKRIYDAKIYANVPSILGFECTTVDDGSQLSISGFDTRTFLLPGHSNDSIAYLLDGMLLFTGDALAAGRLGSTPDGQSYALLRQAIRDRILSMEGEYLVFPGHGPPSTLSVEKATNPSFEC